MIVLDWGDAGARIFISGLVLLVVCSSLLGVMLGWRLREQEVKRLKRKVNVLSLQLSKRDARDIKPLYGGGFKLPGSESGIAKAADLLEEEVMERKARYEGGEKCNARYNGPVEDCRWMMCSRPKGHGDMVKHGYAGVFW